MKTYAVAGPMAGKAAIDAAPGAFILGAAIG
jgi:hypothetical protein